MWFEIFFYIDQSKITFCICLSVRLVSCLQVAIFEIFYEIWYKDLFWFKDALSQMIPIGPVLRPPPIWHRIWEVVIWTTHCSTVCLFLIGLKRIIFSYFRFTRFSTQKCSFVSYRVLWGIKWRISVLCTLRSLVMQLLSKARC